VRERAARDKRKAERESQFNGLEKSTCAQEGDHKRKGVRDNTPDVEKGVKSGKTLDRKKEG